MKGICDTDIMIGTGQSLRKARREGYLFAVNLGTVLNPVPRSWAINIIYHYNSVGRIAPSYGESRRFKSC